jgi:hypothetical protein
MVNRSSFRFDNSPPISRVPEDCPGVMTEQMPVRRLDGRQRRRGRTRNGRCGRHRTIVANRSTAAEFSSSLAHIEFAELEPAITSLLERVGETVGVDRATLVEYGEDGDVLKALFWANPSLGALGVEVDIDETAWLWDRLRPERDALVLERIPADLPAQTLAPTVLYLRRTRRSAVSPGQIMATGVHALARNRARLARGRQPCGRLRPASSVADRRRCSAAAGRALRETTPSNFPPASNTSRNPPTTTRRFRSSTA